MSRICKRCRIASSVRLPDYEATDLAIFTVSQMAKMVERFEELYYRAFATKP
jgi:hypothetical protein